MSPDGTGEPPAPAPASASPALSRTRTRTRSSGRSAVASSSKVRLDNQSTSAPASVAPSPSRSKGKGKAKAPPPAAAAPGSPSKAVLSGRVMPPRVRRAAGKGEDGLRELDGMTVDWFDRYGDGSDSPPGKLRITITSLPLGMVDPPTFDAALDEHIEPVTITPHVGPSKSRRKIETPVWSKVQPGQDDEEEARQELSAQRGVAASPSKRLRHVSSGDERTDETSDDHYHHLHKKQEAFEKKQWREERNKLVNERHKMRTRIDLLRNMSTSVWKSVVEPVMAREDPSGRWQRGKQQVKTAGVDWLRRRLVKEGEEVLQRYDQLLPSDSKRSRATDSRNATPARTDSIASASPPPGIYPARVAALKDSTNAQNRKSIPSRLNGSTEAAKRKRPASRGKCDSPPKRGRSSLVSRPTPSAHPDLDSSSSLSSAGESDHDEDDEDDDEEIAPVTKRRTTASASVATARSATSPARTDPQEERLWPPPPYRMDTRSQSQQGPRGRTTYVTERSRNGSARRADTASTTSTDRPNGELGARAPVATSEVSADEQLEVDRVEAAVVI